MKHMVQTITDNYNAFVGTVIAVISVIFGEHWYLFALFLALNIADWVTGWMKSRIMKKENSVKGWKGVLKKIGYWIMITFAFMIAAGLIEIGEIIGVDLQITTLLGWFVLASLIAAFLYSTNNDKP
ncbi:phage holin family protein [[Clostridium] innocuum]|jgi:toxin secretion/phage lysis holin|nr:phage holin family protein [[Clostridium] innocuum]MCC2837097.1 phage holin family protein [[Clostridium] innocuum]MCH1945794.1 phage holin family protein [[Clostridium] innocuum]MCH1956677.1 phage holin family protein [[Clostridium] innocuum]MCI2984638.1 phage holin family protein [[Clostridium] innocuum]MCI3002344.1 phage holin family protein [[Clostridium] innocuum]